MVVTKDNMRQVIEHLQCQTNIGIDTEGYGTEFDDRLFAVSFATDSYKFYLNLYDGPDYLGNHAPDKYVMPYESLKEFSPVWDNHNIHWFIHNASHDLQKLEYEGVKLAGTVVCTMISERILTNNLGPKDYSLAHCSLRRGWYKIDEVEKCITENKLYTMVQVPGKKKKIKRKHFEKVPFILLAEYAEKDAELHLKIGLSQRKKVYESSL